MRENREIGHVEVNTLYIDDIVIFGTSQDKVENITKSLVFFFVSDF